jgi:molybdate transport system substrate-binding protein
LGQSRRAEHSPGTAAQPQRPDLPAGEGGEFCGPQAASRAAIKSPLPLPNAHKENVGFLRNDLRFREADSMPIQQRALTAVSLAIATLLVLPAESFAQVKVITSGGFASALQDILPEFEKTTGIKVTTSRGPSQGNGPNTIGAQLRRGTSADVVILSREGLDDLIAEGRIVSKSDVNLAQTPLGVAARTGSPKPDISSVTAFKQSLLRAKRISFPSSTTGIYLMEVVFPQLGIADELSGKIIHEFATAVAKGESEIALQPVSELLDVPGVDFVGPVPTEIQYISVFSAAMVTGSTETEAAKRLIAFLASEPAKKAMKKNGMESSK